MKFCSQCGAPVILRVPSGDNRPRHICDTCDTIHYQNPKSSPAAFPNGATGSCCAGEPSNLATGCGPCRRGSWKTANRRWRRRRARPGKRPTP